MKLVSGRTVSNGVGPPARYPNTSRMPAFVAACSAATRLAAQSKAARAAGMFSITPAIRICRPMPAIRMRARRAGAMAPRRSDSAQAMSGMAKRPMRLCACSDMFRPHRADRLASLLF